MDSLLDRHSGQVGKDLDEFIRNFTPDWDQLAPPSGRAGLSHRSFISSFKTSPRRWPTTSPLRSTSPWWNSSGSRKSGCARSWPTCGSPCFWPSRKPWPSITGKLPSWVCRPRAPTLEAAAIPRPQGLEVPLLNLEVVPDWRFAREVWVRSGMGFLGRTWDNLKRRLKLAGEVDPRRQLLRDLERALAALKDWLQEELGGQLLNYREGLKFQYFFPLVDQWLKLQEASLDDTLGSLLGSLQGAAEAMHLAEEERAERRRRLAELIPLAHRIEARLRPWRTTVIALYRVAVKNKQTNVGAHLCVPLSGDT